MRKIQALINLIPICFYFAIVLTACKQNKPDLNYVRSAMWVWDSGYKIGDGDFVDFDSALYYSLFHDTIFRQGIPNCIVVSTDKKKYEMTVRSLDGKFGYYIDTEEFTK